MKTENRIKNIVQIRNDIEFYRKKRTQLNVKIAALENKEKGMRDL
jgi:hypothetical protein